MRAILAVLLLSLSSLACADVRWDDVLRVDFPARNQTVFLAGCFTLYTPFVWAGGNCAGSTVEPLHTNAVYTRHESVTSTVFDTDTVYLIDAPCILVDLQEFEHYRALSLVCYDDVIFTNSFEQMP